jgi:hypothetical protein
MHRMRGEGFPDGASEGVSELLKNGVGEGRAEKRVLGVVVVVLDSKEAVVNGPLPLGNISPQ